MRMNRRSVFPHCSIKLNCLNLQKCYKFVKVFLFFNALDQSLPLAVGLNSAKSIRQKAPILIFPEQTVARLYPAFRFTNREKGVPALVPEQKGKKEGCFCQSRQTAFSNTNRPHFFYFPLALYDAIPYFRSVPQWDFVEEVTLPIPLRHSVALKSFGNASEPPDFCNCIAGEKTASKIHFDLTRRRK